MGVGHIVIGETRIPALERHPQRTAWYLKPQPTFSDALAAVRYRLWTSATLSISPDHREVAKIPRDLLERLTQVACFPA
jgi:hypothetical protein